MAVDVNQIAEIICQGTKDEIDAINALLKEKCDKYFIQTIPPHTIIDVP